MVAYCFLSPKHLEYKILSLDSPHVRKTKGQEKKKERKPIPLKWLHEDSLLLVGN